MNREMADATMSLLRRKCLYSFELIVLVVGANSVVDWTVGGGDRLAPFRSNEFRRSGLALKPTR